MGNVIAYVLLGIVGSALLICVLGLIFRKKIGHDLLGWHDCDATGFDGVSFTGTCKYCGKKCLQDSQGNWF